MVSESLTSCNSIDNLASALRIDGLYRCTFIALVMSQVKSNQKH